MNTDNRIIELLTDMLHEQKNMLHEQKNILQEQKNMLQEQKKTNERLDKLEKQQAKTNIELSDMRLALMKFAEKFTTFTVFEERLTKLEKAVFQN